MAITARHDLIMPGILICMSDADRAKIAKAVSETKATEKEKVAGLIKLALDNDCFDVIPDDWEMEINPDDDTDTEKESEGKG